MKNKICPVCKKESKDLNFCEFCRYPLNVKKLSEYTTEDIIQSLSDLNKVLAKFNKVEIEDAYLKQAYHELFNLNWLRPESALFSFMIIKGLSKYKDYLKYPAIDLGCGDGTFTTILFGGKFNSAIDNYGSIDLNKTDIYNNYTGFQKDILIQKPDKIGFGVDIKENAIKNAKDLGVYDELKVGDIREIPFEDKSVNSVFSNMIDDIKNEDLPKVFQEVYRILKDDGYMIFTTPTENFRKCLFYYPLAKQLSDLGKHEEAQKIAQYDRGRSEWEPRSKEFWEEFLKEHSFKIIAYEPFFDEDLLKFWDTGFRPFFPKLIMLKEKMEKKGLLPEFKKVTLGILKNYFFNLVNRPLNKDETFAIIVAKKVQRS